MPDRNNAGSLGVLLEISKCFIRNPNQLHFVATQSQYKIEAAMKIASTPFYIKNRDLIKDKAELEKHFSEEFKKNAGKVDDLTHSVKEIHSFENIKEKINEDKEKIDEVLKDGDRVVLLEVKIGDKEMTVAIAVALRQGKASVVGVSKVSEK